MRVTRQKSGLVETRFATKESAAQQVAQRGIALVITLVLLSVITFMAVTFLVLSRSQRGAVETDNQQQMATHGAEVAYQHALAETLASMMAFTNEFNYGLRVSTNYISAVGFNTATPALTSPTNVNFEHTAGGGPLNQNQMVQNIANLEYLPRVPVNVTNRLYNSNDFRFFIDLNRNRRYDTNGYLPVISANPALPYINATNGTLMAVPTPGATLSNWFIGDPEWIGGLERPEWPHSATNRFLYRYAYIVLPAGKTLDINTIHNYAKGMNGLTLAPNGGDGYFRNQGVGPWEMNLAAFLVDLNTNLWPLVGPGAFQGIPYQYDTNWPGFVANKGTAFDDAYNLLRYRFGALQANGYSARVYSVNQLFRGGFGVIPGSTALLKDYVDDYTHGPLMLGTAWPAAPLTIDQDSGLFDKPWPGSPNTNHYYALQNDLFDSNKVANGSALLSFTDRLKIAGTNNDSYNRYTFYRLLSELGTDSSPDSGRMNLNYQNVDVNGNVVPNKATNFFSWTASQFFTNAAIRLMTNAGFTVGPTAASFTNVLIANPAGLPNLQIQVWPTNFYTASLHRLLQVAANLYDATTNHQEISYPGIADPYVPTVFRPIFRRLTTGSTNQIFIVGYREVRDATIVGDGGVAPLMVDLALTNGPAPTVTSIPVLGTPVNPIGPEQDEPMVSGYPLVIGARKGFPNFNELALETHAQVTRKLEFRRPGNSNTDPVNETNQMYLLSITNCMLGLEAWNSYFTNYPRNLQISAGAIMTLVMTNEFGTRIVSNSYAPAFITNWNAAAWSGTGPAGPLYPQSRSFYLPPLLNTNFAHFGFHAYSDTKHQFELNFPVPFERHTGTGFFPLPNWWINLRTQLRFFIVDTSVSPHRVVDYVNLDTYLDPQERSYLYMPDILQEGATCDSVSVNGAPFPDGAFFCTNRFPTGLAISSPTIGIVNQIQACLGHPVATSGHANWEFVSGLGAGDQQANAVEYFKDQFGMGLGTYSSTNVFYAPYQPTRDILFPVSWQVNDPLVHYVLGDIAIKTNRYELPSDVSTITLASDPYTHATLGRRNFKYDPWPAGNADFSQVAIKDPQVTSSDSWDFPTNKFPNLGTIGRVHRGTSWQTIYLKSLAADSNTWVLKSLDLQPVFNWGQVSPSLAPLTNWFVDGMMTHPTNDYAIADLFTTSFSDEVGRGKMSINQTNLAAWSALLSSALVLTNAGTPTADVPQIVGPAGVFDAYATPYSNLPPVVQLVTAINAYRDNTNFFPRRVFNRVGDLLKVPQLSVQSPYLAQQAPQSRRAGLNETAFERIPQQILGLVKNDPAPRFVIYAYGQALKPADRSLVQQSGANYGLCTNYQITAEFVTRTVVRIDGVPTRQPWEGAPHIVWTPPGVPGIIENAPYPRLTNLRPVVESFNILPPEAP